MRIRNQDLLVELKKSTQDIIDAVRNDFLDFERDQLLWKSSDKSWSIIECFAHMYLVSEHYLSTIIEIVNTDTTYTTNPCDSYTSGKIGSIIIKLMSPGRKATLKSPKVVSPSSFPDDIIESPNMFLKQQEGFIELLKNIKLLTIDMSNYKIPSLVGKIVSLKLGDALRIIGVHNQRHLMQLKNIKSGFLKI